MTRVGRLTVDDVADFPEEERFELLDGRVVRPVIPNIHQFHLTDAVFAVHENVPTGYLACHRLAVMVDRYNMPFVDVVGIRAKAAFDSPVAAADVVLAVEVLSNWSESLDRGMKMQLYARAGIPSYWLVDPLGDHITVTQFVLGQDGRYRRHLHTADVAVIDQPWPVTLDLPAMTAERDQIREMGRSAS
jgi:hypothetical protein